jgi:hypothetical protein
MRKEMLVIPVDSVVEKKRTIRKNGGPRTEEGERHKELKGLLTPPPPPQRKIFIEHFFQTFLVTLLRIHAQVRAAHFLIEK